MQDNTVFDDTKSIAPQESRPGAERPVLVLLEGGDLKSRYKLDSRELILGRDLSCDVILGDAKSSRRHAKLIYENIKEEGAKPKVSLVDLDSTNGTRVNGKRIKEADLSDRDKILIGSTLFGYFVRDESALKADETLIRLASFDALTGLRNRGVFNLEVNREFDRARRYGRDLSLLMFDIDHFKKFNDTYGHQVGDQVLREIGALVGVNFRSNDVSARYGGEEFAVILPETAMENALIKAERLRKVIMAHPFSSEGTSLSVTVSIGMATLERWMTRVEDLIEAADRALYRAKANGRNQVCWSRARETGAPMEAA